MKTTIGNFLIIIILGFPYYTSNAQDNSLYLIATITGEKTGDQLRNVEWIGDVNGDGFDDMVVNIMSDINYSSLYFGGAVFDTLADIILPNNFAFGAGDVNGDGYNDILHGSLLYLGGPDSLKLSDFNFEYEYQHCPAAAGKFGGVGDVNKDGFGDFILSSNYNWCDELGRVFLFLGGDTLDSIPKLTFMTGKLADDFGVSGAGGDVNGDGYDDLIIGAPIGPGGMDYDTGKVMIYLGGSKMDNIADVIMTSCNKDFGKTIANAGDVDGDGKNNFLISSLNAVYLFQGDTLKYVINAAVSMGFGGYVNAVGAVDLNNDGFDDFLIGNTNYRNSDSVMVGAVWGYYGGANLDTLHDFCVEGETKWSEFSKYMAIIGDINGDGYDEVAVASPYFPDYQNPKGKIYIYSTQQISSVKKSKNVRPNNFRLLQNYPNPFNSSTTFTYNLPIRSLVNIDIYNYGGQKLTRLVSEMKEPGQYHIVWNGNDENNIPVSSGVYIAKITVKNFGKRARKESEALKLILIK